MESKRIKEALKTALMLSKVAKSNHSVEIFEIGEVFIKGDQVSYINEEGKLRTLTNDNVDRRMDEILGEFEADSITEKLQAMVFA